MKRYGILFIMVMIVGVTMAQDPIFSQFYAMPIQTNPAFTGSAFAPRVGVAYRNQWTGFNNAYRTFGAFYEQRVERLNSGFGFSFGGDDAGDGIYKTNLASALYSYRLQIVDGLYVKIGVEAGMHQTNLNWEKLTFPDQIDEFNGVTINTAEIRPEVTTNTRFDISSGLLLVGEKFYFGGALKHLTTPDEGILLVNSNVTRGLPLAYTIQGGTELIVKKGNKHRPASFISPNLLFVAQGPYKQLNLGAYASIGNVFAGLWHRNTFRNADAMIFLVGFKEGIFKLGISYDATISALSSHAGGTYEVTFGLLFDKSDKLKRKKSREDINNCMKMFQ